MFDSFELIWRTFELSLADTTPFLFVFLLFTCGFSLAGHWIFGAMLGEFCTWPKSFTTLFLAMAGGFPFQEMKQLAPISAAIFATAWILIMAMVLANMFVAILTEWYRQVTQQHKAEW